ncbi:hypothetical protein PINS_up000029 [Pythium insidiosum]|nr:hypothetical protein PINS_up000029 [Pythium insidiosum]
MPMLSSRRASSRTIVQNLRWSRQEETRLRTPLEPTTPSSPTPASPLLSATRRPPVRSPADRSRRSLADITSTPLNPLGGIPQRRASDWAIKPSTADGIRSHASPLRGQPELIVVDSAAASAAVTASSTSGKAAEPVSEVPEQEVNLQQ